MGLFSNLPAGLQIKRWFFILTALVIIVDVIAAGSLMIVTNSTRAIVNRYEPLVVYSGDIASSIYKIQTGLYQYLAEYQEDTGNLQKEIVGLEGILEEASRLPAAAAFGQALQEISVALEKYKKVVTLLPKIGAITDWEELEELKDKAIEFGRDIESLATKMKEESYKNIGQQASKAKNTASIAIYVFGAFLLLSIIMVALLFLWWKDFQAMILEL